MKNSQKGFAIVPIIIVLALLIVGGGTYLVLHNKESQTNDKATQTVPVTNSNQNTVVSPSNNQPVFVGTKKKAFCSDEHANNYEKEVAEHCKKSRGGCCG